MILPNKKVISKAMEEVYQKWKKAAERQEKINRKKRAQQVQEEIEKILERW